MSKILFIDPACNKPYTGQTLRTQPLGGTEATVIRVAEALGKSHSVTVMQHNRQDSVECDAVTYSRLALDGAAPKPDVVIVLRLPRALLNVRHAYPNAKRVLWLHDLAGDHMRADLSLADAAVCVSDFHRTHILDFIQATSTPLPKLLTRIYNPIEDALTPSGGPFDRNKLVWLSSPHKGLQDALKLFRAALRFNPDFRLYVSNPGYYRDADTGEVPNVINLGSLPHHEAIAHVRSALCVFYPNFRYPETFGLVIAEANAVGTPVLTCPIGAAPEVLDNPAPQLVDGSNKSVIDRLMAWHGDNRPRVYGKSRYRTSVVATEWERLLLFK